MSYYVWGSSLSYSDYLTGKNFVSDIASASRSAGHEVSMAMSHQTREVIASNEVLAQENIRMMEESADQISSAMSDGFSQVTGALNDGFRHVTNALNSGFDRLSYDLKDISVGINQLNATFHWGFSQMLGAMGHMNDTLSELVKIAKTPVQTVAFNHFEIARDAFRQELYEECLEELEKAIAGDHTSAGYKLEWRFHQLKGVLFLGFADCDVALLDLAKAEEAFLLAARYGKKDYPEDAARAYLSAGWSAYCQGKLPEALAHTEQAINLSPQLGEAFFQAAKVRMAMGQVDAALPVLRQAIDLDRFYALKAAGDGDFQKYDDRLCSFLEAMCREKYNQSLPLAQKAMGKFRFWRDNAPGAKTYPELLQLEAFIAEGENWPFMDMLNFLKGLQKTITSVEETAQNSIVIVVVPCDDSCMREVEYQERESYMEKVVIKPSSMFRREVSEMRQATRLVTKTRLVPVLGGLRHDLYQGLNDPITQIEFRLIPAGDFFMGGNRPITISHKFYLGKYPITQAQWQAVMLENPSRFKRSELPVENVTWDECQAFIGKVNRLVGAKMYRLPTEAEWEYACRAGSTTSYYFGADKELLGDYAWYKTNSRNETHPVGSKKPNVWGLYDMYGNVREWCQDRHGVTPDDEGLPVVDPSGPIFGSHRVTRGGSWFFSDEYANSTSCLECAHGDSDDDLGFRLVASAVD